MNRHFNRKKERKNVIKNRKGEKNEKRAVRELRVT